MINNFFFGGKEINSILSYIHFYEQKVMQVLIRHSQKLLSELLIDSP